ncbi:hypothetical protein AQUCO_11500008v1 [Aquilegia coerulea]|uniref:Membrane lipoprotein n=1 Tax=Aquilegia coerulea TaxID=218851 RepID=A0A2G5C2D8_AQUCA|nr:hypothetical protein AQUCO_11500008v1 [Aquilegia coerulea]
MATATNILARSTITATLLLSLMLLACSITGVKSQGGGGAGDITCYSKCGTDIAKCWPTCSLKGPAVATCMTTCITQGVQCIFDCKKKPGPSPSPPAPPRHKTKQQTKLIGN